MTQSPNSKQNGVAPKKGKDQSNNSTSSEIIKKKQSSQTEVKKTSEIDYLSWFLLASVALITIYTYPTDCWTVEKVSVHHVFYYGWITAVSTGVGSLPFFFLNDPNKYWMGVSNAVAGGMMVAASYSLAYEGASFEIEDFGLLSQTNIDPIIHPLLRTAIGFLFGIGFILLTKKLLGDFEDLEMIDLGGASMQKMVLIIFVMTLHSLSEGIGIGVSFGGRSGVKLGQFISLSLAVHNIPEGLAVGLVLTSRKVSVLKSVLWSIFTSLPQPICAIPAFLFVERFAPLLPAGLGFASGAMSYVAVMELLMEAAEDTSIYTTVAVGVSSCVSMALLQEMVKVSI